jgi:hypothetical protein
MVPVALCQVHVRLDKLFCWQQKVTEKTKWLFEEIHALEYSYNRKNNLRDEGDAYKT